MPRPVPLPPAERHEFASDNTSGACPAVLAALQQASEGCVSSYGGDPWTRKAEALLRDLFETDCEAFFVFNGTAANSLALSAVCRSYHGILCHEYSHLYQHECGAAGFFSGGANLQITGGNQGKIDLVQAEAVIAAGSVPHSPKPRAVSLTQATELGTVYTPEEIAAARALALRHGLCVHMDGARFANACAALGLAPKELSWKMGVDVLCFGGTKNGGLLTEAVIFFDKALAAEFEFRRMQAGQLASKMRYLAAPWAALLEHDLWLRNARHANASAKTLEKKLRQIPGMKILMPVEANGIFLELTPQAHAAMEKKGWILHRYLGDHGYRLMCSWRTTQEEIEAVAGDLEKAVAAGRTR